MQTYNSVIYIKSIILVNSNTTSKILTILRTVVGMLEYPDVHEDRHV